MRITPDCDDKPSPRQSINMGKILLPAYIRHGYLRFEDILNASVITSKIECQKIAEKIAVDILANIESDYEKNNKNLEENNELLSLLSEINQKVTYITPYGKGLENDYAVNNNSDINIYESFENRPDIGVGPGEDKILKEGVKTLRNIKKGDYKKLLSKIIKERLIDLGIEFNRKQEWGKKAVLRPYQPGEDPDFIDEEKSLENILELRRNIENIRYEDFLIKKRKKKNRSIIYIQDVSNTMFYNLEGINSINYSILCLIPLIWGFRREKYGIELYESNTHIIKDIFDEKPIEPILEDLLDMTTLTTTEIEEKFGNTKGSMTWGGTVPNKSIEWAYDKFMNVNNRSDKICFIFSDFVLTEPGEDNKDSIKNYKIIEKMINSNIKIFACVSPLAYKPIFINYTKYSLNNLDKIGVKKIDTYKPKKFLNDVYKLIKNI